MTFLIGVILFIVFVIIGYIYIRIHIRGFINQMGFRGMNLKDIIEEAKLEDQEVPKSLASMDRIYLTRIKKDFPSININELKRKAEKVILDCFRAVEEKDTSSLKGKIKSFADFMVRDYEGKEVRFNHFKIHNTVISKYQCEEGVATIYFSSAFEYDLLLDRQSKKVQDRAKVEFIYIVDEKKISTTTDVIGIHCPNCGSPITALGNKVCSYCGSPVLEVIGRVFTCNDIVRY